MDNWRVFGAPALGWLLAQGMKYVINLRKDGLQLQDLYASGGFPSSHTASTVALSVYIGATDGWTSHIFVLSALFAAIVMYDAFGVRRAVGEHTRILQDLAQQKKVKYRVRGQSTAVGHSPVEVLGGLLLGAVVGLVIAIL